MEIWTRQPLGTWRSVSLSMAAVFSINVCLGNNNAEIVRGKKVKSQGSLWFEKWL